MADIEKNKLAGPEEEYIGHGHEFDNGLMPHARALGAGLADPFGIPSRLLRYYADNVPAALSPVSQEQAKAYRQMMRNARDESPAAAGFGSGVGVMYPIARAGGPLLLNEALTGAPLFGMLGAYLNGMVSDARKPRKRDDVGIPPLPDAPY